MVNAFSGSSTFVQGLIDEINEIGDNSIDLKAAIDQTILCDDPDNRVFIKKLAALDSNLRNLKLLIAQARGVNVANLDTLLMLENCKEY